MANHNLVIDLKSRTDKAGKTYYVGKLEGPFLIDCKDGAVFLLFTSDKGAEQLQIAPMDEKKDKYSGSNNDDSF